MSSPPSGRASVGEVAEAYRRGVEAMDLDAISELLDPLVRWGPLEYPDAGCFNREEALSAFRLGKSANATAVVTELTTVGDRMLVTLRVTGMVGADSEVDVWQLVTVRDGKIVDISGCEEREAGARALGIE
jgi:hypothetical protein